MSYCAKFGPSMLNGMDICTIPKNLGALSQMVRACGPDFQGH